MLANVGMGNLIDFGQWINAEGVNFCGGVLVFSGFWDFFLEEGDQFSKIAVEVFEGDGCTLSFCPGLKCRAFVEAFLLWHGSAIN